MGQFRTAARAGTVDAHYPASVLVALTRFMAEVGIDDRFATTQAWVDPIDGTALIVSAGRPPPLLVQPDGRAEFVGLDALPLTGCGTSTSTSPGVESCA